MKKILIVFALLAARVHAAPTWNLTITQTAAASSTTAFTYSFTTSSNANRLLSLEVESNLAASSAGV